MRAKRRLQTAQAVVCDRLAAPALPCDIPEHVEFHWVGKVAGHHPVPQDEITSLLVRLAKEGKQVVRLKGGDPYVFGRGGEEAETLVANGIPFEVVPSVTAAVAVPGYAGIPVTFRGEVVRVTMVTAHEAVKNDGPQVRWDLLAQDPHAMILGYMGVTNLPNVLQQLLDAGMDPDTPAALIERGTTSAQRQVISTVKNLPEDVHKHGLRPPALFAIGPTIRHAEKLDWFTKRPLHGERMVVVSPTPEFKDALELSGVELVEIPLPITPVARVVMGILPLTGCILKDADEVDALDDERDAPGWSHKMVAWCLSDEAAKRALERGWQHVHNLGKIRDGNDLAERIVVIQANSQSV